MVRLIEVVDLVREDPFKGGWRSGFNRMAAHRPDELKPSHRAQLRLNRLLDLPAEMGKSVITQGAAKTRNRCLGNPHFLRQVCNRQKGKALGVLKDKFRKAPLTGREVIDLLLQFFDQGPG